LGYACIRLKWPWAPRGVFLTSFGAWLLCILIPAFIGMVTAYVYYLKYCSLISKYDLLDWIQFLSVAVVLGVGMVVGGLFRAGKFNSSVGLEAPLEDESSSDGDDYAHGKPASDDESENAELACLNLFVRARVAAPGGPCCFRGWGSCRQAVSRTVGKEWRQRGLPRASWDCGTCCMLQACIGIPFWITVIVYLWLYAVVAPTYVKIESELDRKWGFVLHDGHDYTAPVWMGEFGAGLKGTYWVNFVKYLSQRDLEFAYWPLNPDKLSAGWFDDWGGWHPYPDGPQWDEDSYSILDKDYMTVRSPWRVLDMRPLMESPAGAVLNSQPCQRSVLGRTCGG